MTTHKNTKQHTTIASLLLLSIGLLFSCNTFAWAHHIGEKYGGGIVFYVYDGGLHGLIAALADQSRTGMQWSNGTYKFTGTTGDGVNAGAMNTAMIVATQIDDTPGGNFAAKLCANYGFPLKPGHLIFSKGYELHNSCSFEQAEVRPFVRVSRKTNPGVRFQISALQPLCHLHV